MAEIIQLDDYQDKWVHVTSIVRDGEADVTKHIYKAFDVQVKINKGKIPLRVGDRILQDDEYTNLTITRKKIGKKLYRVLFEYDLLYSIAKEVNWPDNTTTEVIENE